MHMQCNLLYIHSKKRLINIYSLKAFMIVRYVYLYVKANGAPWSKKDPAGSNANCMKDTHELWRIYTCLRKAFE